MKLLRLDDDEIRALLALIDAGVRATGLEHVQNAAFFVTKIGSTKEILSKPSNVIPIPEPKKADGN